MRWALRSACISNFKPPGSICPLRSLQRLQPCLFPLRRTQSRHVSITQPGRHHHGEQHGISVVKEFIPDLGRAVANKRKKPSSPSRPACRFKVHLTAAETGFTSATIDTNAKLRYSDNLVRVGSSLGFYSRNRRSAHSGPPSWILRTFGGGSRKFQSLARAFQAAS
jgi:hypothetical protein